ncbi:MAG: MFS transporter [Eggerthellaceae bacterium]|nr:MFS transporter [Eggerthellaceae bacterium]
MLKNKPFLFYWLAGVFVYTTQFAFEFTVSLYVFDLTGSAAIFGAILGSVLIPRLLLTPLGGIIVDRYNRKFILVVSALAGVCVLCVFGLIYGIRGDLSIPLLFALVILLEATGIVFMNANLAILPSIVGSERLGAANSLRVLYSELSFLIGPLLGSVLYAFTGFGASLLSVAICFGLGCVCVLMIRVPKAEETNFSVAEKPASTLEDTSPELAESVELPEKTGWLTEFREGVQVLRLDKHLLFIAVVAPFILNFFNVPVFDLVLLFFVRGTLELSAINYGIFTALQSGLSIIVALLAGKFYTNQRAGTYVKYFSIAVALSLGFIAVSILIAPAVGKLTPLIITLAGCCCISALIGLFSIASNTIIQQRVPDKKLGRVMSLNRMASLTAIPLGNSLFGVLVSTFGLLASACIACVGVLSIFFLYRMFKLTTNSANSLTNDSANSLSDS